MVVDLGSDGDASYLKRLPDPARRLGGEWHDFGTGEREPWLPARVNLERGRAGSIAGWGATHLSARWRRTDPDRILCPQGLHADWNEHLPGNYSPTRRIGSKVNQTPLAIRYLLFVIHTYVDTSTPTSLYARNSHP